MARLSFAIAALVAVTHFALSFDFSDAMFAISLGDESHVETCSRLGLDLAGEFVGDQIPWGPAQVAAVARTLGRRVAAGVVIGCCATGLWCSEEECFTQSLAGYFINAENSIGDHQPVFACRSNQTTSQDFLVSSFSYVNAEESLSVTSPLMGVGASAALLQMNLGHQRCRYAEVCSKVCSPCAFSTDCPSDSLCIGDGYSSHCFAHCGGVGDTSCPCGQKCHTVIVNAGPFETNILHLCAPFPFDESSNLADGACKGYTSRESNLQCSTNAFFATSNSTNSSWYTFPLSLYGRNINGSHTGTQNISYLPLSCARNDQCEDGDVCTLNWCEEGRCMQTQADSECQSTIPAVQDSLGPDAYLVIVQSDQQSAQTNFLSLMNSFGSPSPASKSYDAPHLLEDLGFEFVFFGNAVDKVAISPNGYLQLPPFLPCTNALGSVEVDTYHVSFTSRLYFAQCVVFSSFTNVISLWASDWATPVSRQQPSIRYLKQFPSDTSRAGAALHVSYSDIIKWSELNTTKSSTISSSIYSDGSIRMRYHDINSRMDVKDTFGNLYSA